jgi:hypothetical protein
MPASTEETKNPDNFGRKNYSQWESLMYGGLAGLVAPLSNYAVPAFNGHARIALATFDLPFICIYVLIGGIVAMFLSDGDRKQVFAYGVAAPFLVLSIINKVKADEQVVETQRAQSNVQILQRVNEDQSRNAAESLANPPVELGAEAEQAVQSADFPTL